MLRRPDEKQLEQVFALKRRLVAWRKVITPERDLFARLLTGVVDLPGMTPDTERYYRDVYDHLIRISDLVDSYRDLLTGAMDVYLSTVSNRLNEVMKRLTIVATIFMPLTWIVGFFGMNFAWMVRDVDGWPAFVALGVVTQVVAAGRHARPVPPPALDLRRGRGGRHPPASTHVLAWSTATKPKAGVERLRGRGREEGEPAGAGAQVMTDRRGDGRRGRPAAPVRVPRADRVQAGDVADLRAAGHGHGASVVQGEEGRGVGPRGEPDAEQALAPVHGQAEGVGQHVAGGEDPLHPGDAHRLVRGLDAHHVTGVRAHEGQVAGGGEAEGGGGLGRLRRHRGGGVDARRAARGGGAPRPPRRCRRPRRPGRRRRSG